MFYNPGMAWDRDLGVAFVRAWAPGGAHDRTGWDVTAATGVRGLRLFGETAAFSAFTLTESNERAFTVLAANAARTPGTRAIRADAREPPPPGSFEYVDLDPYGSPLPFLDGALRATATGGVLAVTATDLPVLAGAQAAATLRRYGARPVRGRLGPEGGLRILLMRLALDARRAGRSVRPLLAYVRGHYVRVYVLLEAGGDRPDPVGTIEDGAWTGPPLGPEPRYGPLWLGPLADPAVVARMEPAEPAGRGAEVAGFLGRYREELEVPAPFYYEPNSLAARLGLRQPPSVERLREALAANGFRAARTHVRSEGLRTDAPRSDVDRIARALAGERQSQNARVRA